MDKKIELPEAFLDAISGGVMFFGAEKVTDCSVDDSGVTLTLGSGDQYFRSHSAQERTMYQSDPKFFEGLLSSSLTDDSFVVADTSQYKKI